MRRNSGSGVFHLLIVAFFAGYGPSSEFSSPMSSLVTSANFVIVTNAICVVRSAAVRNSMT